ncbi:MerR family transcriptional regulator [Parvibaculum sp.]|uniref:MerR family transcriptional regulator n=1 Tax=Parvibaculum sp. TaxID=2024848 RepID=UPI003918A6C7
MKMKELEAATGIGRETIRYYIREGLLPEPVRPKRNVAAYGREHVKRLNLIRKLQQERHLPLSVIKTIVTSETGEPAGGFESLIGLEVAMGPLLADGRNLAPKKLADVAKDTGLPLADIRKFAEIGLIHIDQRDGTEWLNQRNVRIMEIISQTRADGFVPDIGYTVESYDFYPQMIELLARRAVVGFYSRLGDKLDQPAAAKLAVNGIRTLSEMVPLMLIERIVRMVEKISESGELPTEEDEV